MTGADFIPLNRKATEAAADIAALRVNSDAAEARELAIAAAAAYHISGYTQTDTFTGTGSGAIVDCSAAPCTHFTIQVKGTGTLGAATWTVGLRGSLNGTDFITPLFTHTNAAGNGGLTFGGAVFGYAGSVMPIKYWRIQCTALALDTLTNIVVTSYGHS